MVSGQIFYIALTTTSAGATPVVRRPPARMAAWPRGLARATGDDIICLQISNSITSWLVYDWWQDGAGDRQTDWGFSCCNGGAAPANLLVHLCSDSQLWDIDHVQQNKNQFTGPLTFWFWVVGGWGWGFGLYSISKSIPHYLKDVWTQTLTRPLQNLHFVLFKAIERKTCWSSLDHCSAAQPKFGWTDACRLMTEKFFWIFCRNNLFCKTFHLMWRSSTESSSYNDAKL